MYIYEHDQIPLDSNVKIVIAITFKLINDSGQRSFYFVGNAHCGIFYNVL